MVSDYIHYRNILFDRNIQRNYKGFDVDTNEWKKIEWVKMKPWPTPGDIMSKHYDMKLVSLAYPGSGNEQIYNKLAEYVIENHKSIGIVVACWTSFSRKDFAVNYERAPLGDNTKHYQTMVYNHFVDHESNKNYLNDQYDNWLTLVKLDHIYPEREVDDFYRYSIALDLICKNYGIELVQCASIITWPYQESAIKYFIDHPLMPQVNRVNFYGWPIFYELGGNHLMLHGKEHCISEYDGHPTEATHKYMANTLIDFIDQRGIL